MKDSSPKLSESGVCFLCSRSLPDQYFQPIVDIGATCEYQKEVGSQFGFLGCPLKIDELRERLSIADTYCIAQVNEKVIGYAFGYSSGACFSHARDTANTMKWNERDLLNRLPTSKGTGCLFQLALDPRFRLQGLGRSLCGLSTEMIIHHDPTNRSYGFIPESPRNTLSLNTAIRVGYRICSEFNGDGNPVSKWNLVIKGRL